MEGFFRAALAKQWERGEPDPFTWVFSSTDNRKFNYNSRALFLYVRENCPQIHPLYVINDPSLREKLAWLYGEKYFTETLTLEGMRRVLRAGVWFTSAGLPVYAFGVGKKRRIVNLWHGLPLKRIALMEGKTKGISLKLFHKVFSDNYSDIVTSSSHLVPVMAKSFDVEESRIRVWGQPRCDELLRRKTEDEKERKASRGRLLRRIYRGAAPVRKLILYAPTFRDNKPVRLFPFPDYDRDKLEAFLAAHGIFLVIGLHLREKARPWDYLSEHVLFMPQADGVEAGGVLMEDKGDLTYMLDRFDLLITDYSSIYLDFLLLNRPVVFLPYDRMEYEETRGFNFLYEEVTPGPKPASQSDFEDALESALFGEDSWREERERTKKLFHEIDRPCCEHIVSQFLPGWQEDDDGMNSLQPDEGRDENSLPVEEISVMLAKADLLWKQGKNKDALLCYAAVRESEPDAETRAILEEKLGDLRDAAIDSCLSLIEEGEKEDARTWLDLWLRIFPDHEELAKAGQRARA